jgi:predicted site-specific integrase-resolvase
MEKVYNVTEFAEMIGKCVKTLQRWDRDGILKAYRSPSNRRKI